MTALRWYFDLVSPFSYLQLELLPERVPAGTVIEYRPILFAGLLDAHGHKGPAEIEAKRTFTYQRVLWEARRLGIPLTFPPAHPFNPLPLLRLAVVIGNDGERLRGLFRWVWREGRVPGEAAELDAVGQALGVEGAATAIQGAAVKAALRANFDEALAAGVFGVPTAVVDGHLFWGVDSTDMLAEYLHNPGLFEDPEMRRLAALPKWAERPGAKGPQGDHT